MQFQTNPELKLAFDFLQYTNENVFLTGKAGTGKTTFLKNLKIVSPKRMVVVAPTGVAAINAGGVTIHSFFQLSFGPQVPNDPNAQRHNQFSNVAASAKRFNKEKINIIRSLDLLVIDEISMVRADMLDSIDEVLRRYKNRYKPFGGVQLLMIGDLQQLAPVVKDSDWDILRNYYETAFFFSSRALGKSNFIGIELKQIFRQSDQTFIDLLNKIRENKLDNETIELLNRKYQPGFNPSDDEGFITLTTHNYQAQQINDSKLVQLKTSAVKFKAEVEGEFPEYAYPTDEVLKLKVGTQVMFVKNDPSYDKRFYNGKIGKVVKLSDKAVEVLCPGETDPIEVGKTEWENTKYSLNDKTQEIEEYVVGRFNQVPLKLAWAITIHKSQGLTFERAIIDACQSFAHGQVYVAFSRCKSLKGLVLSTPLSLMSVKSDKTVLGFTKQVEQNQPDENVLDNSRRNYEQEMLTELFDFKPLLRNMQYLMTLWAENANFLMGNLHETIRSMAMPINIELVQVAEKFDVQINQLIIEYGFAERNQALQERLKKGAAYFSQKLKQIIEDPLNSAGFQTDNKTIRKRLADVIARIEKELDVKRACIDLIQENGLELKVFLDVRAKAAIDKPTSGQISKTAMADTNFPDFYKRLVAWRDAKADELEVEIAQIMRQKVLLAIADSLPPTAYELKSVKGMGGKKMQLFGKDILGLILQYRQEQEMELPLNAKKEVAFAGLDTKEISFELFRQGLSINAISKERKLATSTIESHLAHFIALGELDVFKLVDKAKYDKIAELVNDKSITGMGEIRTKLNDDCSYGEIKMVMANMGR